MPAAEPSIPVNKVVKSAGRVMAVLELFQAEQRPMTAKEMTRILDLPRSSTNALLSSLVKLGYLLFDRDTNCYFPTLKVGLLGDWMIGSVRGDQAITRILQEISASTGETAAIAVRSGFDMQFVTIIPSTFPVALNIEEGALADLFESAVGVAWFTAQDPYEIEVLTRTYNKTHKENPVNLDSLLKRVEEAKNVGAAVAYEKVLPDTGAIAAAYARTVQGQTLVIGVGGPQDRIRRSEAQIVGLIRRLNRSLVHRAHG